MAEQIRSFWSHLCGIFGAIFGIIAGGTLVHVTTADAFNTSACNASATTAVVDGASVKYCYQSDYDGLGTKYYSSGTTCARNLSYAYPDGSKRYYVYFNGCADGYYQVLNTVSSGWITPSISGLTSTGVCAKFSPTCYDPNNSSMWLIVCESYTAKTGRGLVVSKGMETVEEQVKGICAKCPSYDEIYNNYTANSNTFPRSISSCYMSYGVERNDAIENNGDATGTFIWTENCNYDPNSTGGFDGGGIDTTYGGITVKVRELMEEVTGNTATGAYSTNFTYNGVDATTLPDVLARIEEYYNISLSSTITIYWSLEMLIDDIYGELH